MNRRLVLVCALCLALSACQREGKQTPMEELPSLTIGLIPERDLFEQMRRYRPLADYLGQKVGAEITLKPLPRYGNIIQSFRDGEMDGAFFGSFTYVLAHARLGVEVLARPEEFDGSSTYHGMLIVRTDSGIQSLEDLEGRSFAFVDRATTAGYLFPLSLLRLCGHQNASSFFGETYFAGTHQGVLLDVLEGRVVGGAMKNTVFDDIAERDSRVEVELTVLARSADVPENGLAVRAGLDADRKESLKRVLCTMHEDAEGRRILKEFGAHRFIATSDRNYAPVREIAASAGIDVAGYDYEND